jgi:NADH dehydrogenase
MTPTVTKIVILGGGFGGLATARELERLLPRDAPVHITLVNRENYSLFTPMLHEVAASDLDLSTIVNPLRKLLKVVQLFVGTVERIDTAQRRVTLAHARGAHRHELSYDHLVLALGSVTNYFDIPGLAQRALPMKTLVDAAQLRNQLIEHLEEADFECSADIREPLLTFVVAGGGFAGVETVGAIHDFLHHAVRFYANLRAADLRVVIVHPGVHLLPELGEELGTYTTQRLRARGIDVVLDAKVSGLDDDVVTLSNGLRLRSRTVVWTAGVSANPMLDAIECAKVRGRVMVDAFLRVTGATNLWAIGDCAHATDSTNGKPYPPTAQHALRQGKCVAANLMATVSGGELRPFVFSTLGLLASIGRRTGVANILGWNFSGFVAWWLWRTIYLAKLPRFEKKVRVALDWALDLLFSKDLVQFASRHQTAGPGTDAPAVTSTQQAPPIVAGVT